MIVKRNNPICCLIIVVSVDDEDDDVVFVDFVPNTADKSKLSKKRKSTKRKMYTLYFSDI